MKKLTLTLSLIATLFFMASCTGGGGSNLIGTWGLTQFSWEEYLDGELIDSDSMTLDPADPNTDDDMKLDISHIDGDEYLFTSYEWSPKKGEWRQLANLTVTIQGNKIIYDGENVTFSVSGNTLTITVEESEVDEDGTWVFREKNIYKRLSSPKTETEPDKPAGGGLF